MHRALVLIVLLLTGNVAGAQWVRVGNRLIAPNATTGAMSRAGRAVWVGADRLFKSIDAGDTWRTDPNWPTTIVAMNFIDSLHGLVTAGGRSGGLAAFSTTDGGETWRRHVDVTEGRGVGYLNSSREFMATTFEGVLITRDAGANWSTIPTAPWNHDIASTRSPISYVLAGPTDGSTGEPTHMWNTQDFGVSWQRLSPSLPYDIYSIAVDSCDARIIYALDEDYAMSEDGLSQIFRSTNSGLDWKIVSEAPRPFFNGAIHVTSDAIYAPCMIDGKGIQRSTDHGESWMGIGGPALTDDTRLVCALDDNVLLAFDRNGVLWRTDNSGGYPHPDAAPLLRPLTANFEHSATSGDTAKLRIYFERQPDKQVTQLQFKASWNNDLIQLEDAELPPNVSVVSKRTLDNGPDAGTVVRTEAEFIIKAYNVNDTLTLPFSVFLTTTDTTTFRLYDLQDQAPLSLCGESITGTTASFFYTKECTDTTLQQAMNGKLRALTVGITPNPASTMIQVTCSEIPTGKITLSNAAGNTVRTIETTEREFTIDVNKLPRGAYFLKVEQRVVKFVVE